jgi:hypothetical protein
MDGRGCHQAHQILPIMPLGLTLHRIKSDVKCEMRPNLLSATVAFAKKGPKAT